MSNSVEMYNKNLLKAQLVEQARIEKLKKERLTMEQKKQDQKRSLMEAYEKIKEYESKGGGTVAEMEEPKSSYKIPKRRKLTLDDIQTPRTVIQSNVLTFKIFDFASTQEEKYHQFVHPVVSNEMMCGLSKSLDEYNLALKTQWKHMAPTKVDALIKNFRDNMCLVVDPNGEVVPAKEKFTDCAFNMGQVWLENVIKAIPRNPKGRWVNLLKTKVRSASAQVEYLGSGTYNSVVTIGDLPLPKHLYGAPKESTVMKFTKIPDKKDDLDHSYTCIQTLAEESANSIDAHRWIRAEHLRSLRIASSTAWKCCTAAVS